LNFGAAARVVFHTCKCQEYYIHDLALLALSVVCLKVVIRVGISFISISNARFR
jgi:hypothetical protein